MAALWLEEFPFALPMIYCYVANSNRWTTVVIQPNIHSIRCSGGKKWNLFIRSIFQLNNSNDWHLFFFSISWRSVLTLHSRRLPLISFDCFPQRSWQQSPLFKSSWNILGGFFHILHYNCCIKITINFCHIFSQIKHNQEAFRVYTK